MNLFQNKQINKFNESEIRELKQTIKKKFEQEQIKFIKMPLMIGLIIISCIALGTFAVLIFLTFEIKAQIILIFVLVLCFIGIGILGSKYWKIKTENNQLFDKFKTIRDQSFMEWFNKYYDDITISYPLKKIGISQQYFAEIINLERSAYNQTPRITNVYPGYQFETKKGIVIDTFIATMLVPLAPMANASFIAHAHLGRELNQQIPVPYFFAVIHNNEQKWNNFQVKIDYSRANDKSLENDEFNAKLGYQSNDPIRLRMLLTPWTQEQLAKQKNFRWNLTRQNKTFFWYGKYIASNNIFDFKRQFKTSQKQMINIIANDIIADIEILQDILQNLSHYKSIVY